MKKIFIAVVFVLAIVTTGRAQNISITPSVQPSMGGSGQIGNAVFDYTVGEPFQTTLQNGNNMFTQGFQQPEKPLPPVAPSSQTVCSDTAVTFVFTNRIAGAGANQTEWSLFHDFSYSTFNGTDSALKITVAIGQTDTIYFRSRVSGNALVSDSVVHCILKVNYKPQPPTPPVPVSVNSDTAYTFHFINLNPGFGGNRLEWSLDSFATSYFMTCFDTVLNGKDTSSCTISVKVHPLSDTLIWVRSVDTVTGCLSNSKTSIAVVTHVFQRQPINVDSTIAVCIGNAATIKIPGTHHYIRYDLLTDTGRVTYAYGNDTTLSISTGNLYNHTFFNILTTDTSTGDTATLGGAILVTAINMVDSSVLIEGDTLVYMNDTAYYEASAKNAFRKRYSIVSGAAAVDSLTGMVTGIGSGFIIRATLSGPTGCGNITADRHVGVSTIAPPVAPGAKVVYLDSVNQTVTISFDSILAGAGGDQIEWATDAAFASATIVTAPATINITLTGVADTAIWIRTRNSTSLKHSKAKTTRAATALSFISAGLLDKSNWVIDEINSDEFDHWSQFQYTDNMPNSDFNAFRSKWSIIYNWGGGQADATNICNYTIWSNVENELYDWGNCPENTGSANTNCGETGCGHEVSFLNGAAHLKASRLRDNTGQLITVSTTSPSPAWTCHDPIITKNNYYSAGMLGTINVIPLVNSMVEIRAKFPSNHSKPEARVGFWDYTGFSDFTALDGGTNTTMNGGTIDEYTNSPCGIEIVKQTPCGFAEDWHTITLVCTPTQVVRFVDGKETWSTNFSNSFNLHAVNAPTDNRQLADRWPSAIYTNSTWSAPWFIGIAAFDWDLTGPQPDWWEDADYQIDYFRHYTPANPGTVHMLQNLNSSGIAQTLERPYNWNLPPYNTPATNNKVLNIANTHDHKTRDVQLGKIAYTNEPGLEKIYYLATNGKCYNAYKSGSDWVEYALTDNGADVNDVLGGITVDGNRVYYYNTQHEIRFFQWVTDHWANFPTGEHCKGSLNIDHLGRLFYIGQTDGNIYAWCPTGNTTGARVTIVSDGTASTGLSVHSCGCLLYYKDAGNNLQQKSWWNSWRAAFPVASDATRSMVMDEANSVLYYAGLDNAGLNNDLHRYEWDFNAHVSGLKKLGTTCSQYDNAAYQDPGTEDPQTHIALSPNKNMILYQTVNQDIWYYFNDFDHGTNTYPIELNWFKSPLMISDLFSNRSLGTFVFAPGPLGNLFYAGLDYDGTGQPSFPLFSIDWTTADNPLTCPTAPIAHDPQIAFYKTEANGSKPDNNIQTKYNGADTSQVISISVFPNPSAATFTFRAGNVNQETDMDIQIEDINSRCVYKGKRKILPGKVEQWQWETGSLNNGFYFYRIKLNSGEFFAGKLLKLQ